MKVTGLIIAALLVSLRRGNTVRQAIQTCVPSKERTEWIQFAIDAGVDPDSTAEEILGIYQR